MCRARHTTSSFSGAQKAAPAEERRVRQYKSTNKIVHLLKFTYSSIIYFVIQLLNQSRNKSHTQGATQMEFKQLAANVSVFLTPFLPYLVSASEAMAEEVGKKFGEAAWKKAKFLWSKIKNLVSRDSKLENAANGLSEDPEDEDYRLIFVKSLTKQLEKLPELANELVALIKDDKSIQKILIEQEVTVNDILQRLSRPGEQETIVRGKSQVGNITQKQ